MSMSPTLLLRINEQSARIARERAETRDTADQNLDDAVEKIVAEIPRLIAEKQTDGGSYAEIMTLLEGRDFSCPSWKDSIFSKSPKETWLKGCAAAVFAWCQESGLQPFLSPHRGYDGRESRIVVQWQPGRVSVAGAGNEPFLAQLVETTVVAQAARAAERTREQVKTVRKAIQEMHANITSASKRGGTEVKVTSAYSGSSRTEANMREGGWTKELVDYCEALGLRIRVTCELDNTRTWPSDTFRTDIYASWESGAQVRKYA